MDNYFLDTETCGRYGVPVLLQYQRNDDPIVLVDLWTTPAAQCMYLIERMVNNRVIAHNINFDWQMVSKWYNMCRLVPTPAHDCMADFSMEQRIAMEYESRNGLCLKPSAAVDTMLLSAKGDNQSSLMAAKPIYVRRVPIDYAQKLADELTARTDLPWILFAGKKQEPFAKWNVLERVDDDGEVDLQFADVVLKFKPSNGLKQLHRFLFNSKLDSFADVMPAEFPDGPGYCPYVTPLLDICNDNYTYEIVKSGKKVKQKLWPALIDDHIEFWATNERARTYGQNDIVMLNDLYKHFGAPDNDDDAILACQIASVRLVGFPICTDSMQVERERSSELVKTAPVNVNSPKQVKEYIAEVLDPMEQLIVAKSANAETLEAIVKEFTLEEEEDCECEDQKFCLRCGGTGVVGPGPMVVAQRAKKIEEIRDHKKRVELFDKLLLAGRAYPNFRAVGTKSGRLSGTDGLNFQGINSSILVRSMFTLADPGEVLSGGDYDGQEVAIAGTTMNDDALLDDMKKGKKIHGLFAAELFETTYDDILSTKEDDPLDRYGKGKSAVFLTIYGGTYQTMAQRAGVPVEVAEKAFTAFVAKYPGVGHTKKMINDRFSAIERTPEGKMKYVRPETQYIESIFGFRRHFSTEFKLQEMIFDLATNLPDEWREDQRKIVRDTKNQREQTMAGALCSALFGAAYSVGNGVIRAANNHLIQSAGRTITVGLQQKLWTLQPVGCQPFEVKPMSVHDEIAAVTPERNVEPVSDVVRQTLDDQCEIVPLLMMDWGRRLGSWGDMKKVNLKDYDAIHAGIDL